MSTFLIIGGTGKVGSRVTQYLTTAGHVARVASRTGGDVRFDWRDADSYRPAVEGADGIFIVGPGSATDWSPSLTRLLEVAAAAGVRRVVLLSARGVEFLPDGAVARAERAVQDGSIPWTILRPSHFAQNFTEAMFVPVDGAVIAPVGDGAEPFVDVDDIAQVASTVFGSDDWRNEIIDISGPSALGFVDAVAVLAEHTGRPTRFEDESAEDHIARLRSANTPEGYIEWRMAMLGGIRSGADAYVSDGVERVLGRPATSFPEWAAREALA
jgi:uncharacterized protein YbjT (DUF2867 family)